jgi:hypothetical protein
MKATITARPDASRARSIARAAATRLGLACLRGAAVPVAASVVAGVGLTAAYAGAEPSAEFLSGSSWILAVAGVTGMFLAGRGLSRGWLLLLCLQPLWIAYAVLTGQYGFVVGSLAYAAAQLNGYVRTRREG